MAWRGVFVQDRLGIAAWSESNANLLLRSFRLPKELSRSLPEAVLWHAHKPWEGKEAYVVWFHDSGTIDAYGENEVREFLDLETVLETADATLYRVPLPENLVLRGPGVSEVLDLDRPGAAPWTEPGGLRYGVREAPVVSAIFANDIDALPDLRVAAPRLSEVWGLGSWPRLEWKFDPVTDFLMNLVGFIALLVAPLWFFLKHPGRFEVWFITLPALYLHAVYSVASHFLPRYAQPEIPLRVWATLLLVCLFTAFVHRAGCAMMDAPWRRGPRQAQAESASRAA